MADENNILTVYRGQLIKKDEIDFIRSNKNGYIAMNTFLSTSLSSSVAANFQGNGEQRPFFESVMFEIKIDFSTLTSSTVPFALISQMSTKPDEQEIVFSIGSVFRIDQIDDECDPIWQIKLTLDSSQTTGLINVFDFYAKKTNLLPTSLLDLSDIFLLIDDYDRAEKYNRILLEQIHDDHSDVPKIYNNLADIFRCRGNFIEADRYLTFAEESRWRDVTLSHIRLSRGLLFDAMRKYKLARDNFFEAKSLVENDGVKYAQILKCIGLTYKHEGNHNASLVYYEEARQIQQHALPDNHPALIDTYDCMATIYSEQLEFERAMETYTKVLTTEKKILPLLHSAIARTYSNIGFVFYNQDNFDAALDNYNMSLKIFLLIYGSEYRELGTIFTKIGDIYNKKMVYTNAESIYEMAFGIHQKYLPSSEIDLVLTYNAMGNLRRDHRQFNEVIWYYDKALDILLLSTHANENKNRALIYSDYGQYYHMINEWKQAIDYYKKSLKELEIIYGDNNYHPSIVKIRIQLGHTYKEVDDLDNAMKQYIKSFQLLTKLDRTSGDQKQHSNRSLGHAQRIFKNYYTAFFYYEKSANLNQLFDQPYNKYIIEIYAGVANVLIKQNQIDKAIEIYKKIIALELMNSSHDEHFLASVQYKIATLYLGIKNYESALICFDFALASVRQILVSNIPMLADILFERGMILTNLGKYDEALSSHYESLKYRTLEQELASSHHEIAKLLLILQDRK
jgi:tetratricopeptide (TPR) repeat protein